MAAAVARGLIPVGGGFEQGNAFPFDVPLPGPLGWVSTQQDDGAAGRWRWSGRGLEGGERGRGEIAAPRLARCRDVRPGPTLGPPIEGDAS